MRERGEGWKEVSKEAVAMVQIRALYIVSKAGADRVGFDRAIATLLVRASNLLVESRC